MKNQIVTGLALILIASISIWSCHQNANTGPAIATDCSSATSGDAIINVSVPVVTFGDKVAEAATKGIEAYIQTLKGPLNLVTQKEAVERGVAAGEKKAADEGKTLTEANKNELREKVQEAVDRKTQSTRC